VREGVWSGITHAGKEGGGTAGSAGAFVGLLESDIR
jgi:hypothetical protein